MQEELVTLTRQEYQDLIDARDAALTLEQIARGEAETFTETEADRYLAAPSPLNFWRTYRNMSLDVLAREAGADSGELAEADEGRLELPARVYARLARALRTRIEDLLPVDVA
jgi:hypothetical protein